MLRQACVLGSDLLLGNLYALCLGNRAKGQVRLNLPQGGHLCLLPQAIHGHPHHLQVLLKGKAPILKPGGIALDHLVSLKVHHGFGDLGLHAGDQLGEDGVLECALRLFLAALLQLLGQISLQFLQRVKFGNVLRELIVHNGGNGSLDLVNRDLEHHRRAVQILHAVILREGDADLLCFAGAHAHDLLLKAGDKGAGAQLQGIVLRLAALKGNAVLEAFKVDDCGVAVLRRALNRFLAGSLTDLGRQLLLDILLRDLDLGLGRGQALVLAQLGHRLQADGGLKGKALCGGGTFHLHLGIAHDLQAGLLDGIGQRLGIQVVDGLLIENIGAVHLLDNLAGDLALAEAGDLDAVLLTEINLLDGRLKFLGGDFNRQDGGTLLLLFNIFQIHCLFLL